MNLDLCNKIINNKYILIEKITNGSFGMIYKGENVRTREQVAIKVEPINSNFKLIKNESTIYHYLNNTRTLGVPTIKWFGKDNDNYYMVLNLLGESLQTIHGIYKKFSLKTTLQLGIKILILLETIHEKGLIHRDIKPDNFLMALNSNDDSEKNNDIYLIDFGFCKSFISNSTHIPDGSTGGLIGSLSYASLNSHNCKELSRRDDLESLGYMLLYFYLGSLSWQNKNNINDKDLIKQMKHNLAFDKKIPLVLTNFIKYVRELKFEEKPNYSFCKDNFQQQIEEILSSKQV